MPRTAATDGSRSRWLLDGGWCGRWYDPWDGGWLGDVELRGRDRGAVVLARHRVARGAVSRVAAVSVATRHHGLRLGAEVLGPRALG